MEFEELIDSSPLAVLVTSSDAEGQKFVIGELTKAGRADEPVYKWTSGAGFEPVSAPEGTDLGIKTGACKDDPGGALKHCRTIAEPCFILICGADDLTYGGHLKMLLQKHREAEDAAARVVMFSQGGKLLINALRDAGIDPEQITYEHARPAEAAPKAAACSGRFSPDDVKRPELFDTPEWTEHLNRLSIAELQALNKEDIYCHCLTRVGNLCAKLKKIFVEKEELIDLMATCTIAQLPLLMLGTWGTGKSMLVRKMAEGLGIYPEKFSINCEDKLVEDLLAFTSSDTGGGQAAPVPRQSVKEIFSKFGARRHFEYLVTRFTTPEELLGGVNIEVMLRRAVHLRQTAGLLPRAEIVFLDEVFKANSSILNTLLSVMNERLFYNAGVPLSVNMVMLFGASNEPPQDEELGAFYDRFPIRAMCEPVHNDSVKTLLDHAHTQSFASLIPPGADPAQVATLDVDQRLKDRHMSHDPRKDACVNDFRLLQKISLLKFGGIDTAAAGSEAFMECFARLFTTLRGPYDISDRSCGHFYRLARAHALFKGDDALGPAHCEVLKYAAKHPEAARRLPAAVKSMIG